MFTVIEAGVNFIKGYGLIAVAPATILALIIGLEVIDLSSNVLSVFDPITKALGG